ncbi:MAG TPA: isoprenylcysteine carboxylmethyltransferase family protein [Muricauda sp.]|uniref:Isoprenylcysteine carboxylmethyltransferase family protein n=1 Tax=Flagellimonas aurea TaxID=2915619 RepID=A0ABS3G4B9_9FLAO|nr:isoprenylcysteine carboxylmethyltransferase family protein [Allomuricauda aurea]MAO16417.1 protein-S-isoprenylcysteine methyltransferase [Allomuricauda sp.]MBO0354205.1 isoprenylcysteine carboxylmethyltransferase family protein [Allomuricauda aurea]HBU78885.1 isoprenylcysteine carboxylmethyltransferase family protein [Allomuricauda sp.]|tara:strand:- start:46 stop:498 length:453 start_codon:yes stop_codon:yes gene_type:complete
MKMKVPPALVMLVFGVLMYVLDRFLPVGEFDFFGKHWLIWFLFGLGSLVILISVIQFLIQKTTTDPLNPNKASKLVTNGIYNFTRNPMYLGMLLFLLAYGLNLGNAFNTLVAAGFVSYMNHFQIKPEEEALKKIFGQEYNIYCKLTRRWF